MSEVKRVTEGVFLRIDKGEPHRGKELVPLQEGELLLGRIGRENAPDVTFTSPYISRRHAAIRFENGQFTITDLASKHGVQVNGYEIEQNRPYILKNSDKVNLAQGVVLLTFVNNNEIELEPTLEFTNPLLKMQAEPQGLVVYPERREILIDGCPLLLSGKHTELLIMLYQKRNQAVSYDEIKVKIWPERITDESQKAPDVGRDEINALIYRLRKKLGSYGERIVTVSRYGYMLDLE
ncbi:FHA domain-containing protein [Aneurinibacillus aneurinilyticus]|jgi:DNA-binding winged helix-turn-helix (wHTH) protein|uniref:FHA domain-containing protein n=1 Tax=Aneurinibacillus aneurinilyticus TaxID=1391 RepID=UPI0023F7B2F0|nr:FHA domain-containing protein [Aneurinibacillus aneurinilyticus]MCI1694597.1 FHA domain-containing protein [Aneurinibacillus aneurinilyticus]